MQRFAMLMFAAGTLAACAAAADAALVVRVTSGQAAPGATVHVGVFVTDDGAAPTGSATAVNAYGVGVFVDPTTPGATFGGATPTDTGTGFQAPQFLGDDNFFDAGDYLANQQSVFVVNNLTDAAAGQVPAFGGSGLFQADFTIPADALPGTTYALLVDDDASSFSTPADADGNSTNLPFTRIAGTITVTAVPEPATLALLAAAPLMATRRRRPRAIVA